MHNTGPVELERRVSTIGDFSPNDLQDNRLTDLLTTFKSIRPHRVFVLWPFLVMVSFCWHSGVSRADVKPEDAIADECAVKPEPSVIRCSAPRKDGKLHLDAVKIQRLNDDRVQLSGDVCARQEDKVIATQSLLLDRAANRVDIQTPLRYVDGKQTVNAREATLFLQQDTAQLTDITFHILNSNVNGRATSLQQNKNQSVLENISYTTCPPEHVSWEIRARRARLDLDKQEGTFHHLSLRFKNTPILYLPWARLPLNDERRSGFLVPGVGYSSVNGWDIAVPYYFNLAPNRDLTLTPRYIQQNGFMLKSEFRYLGATYRGQLEAEYLPNDAVRHIDRYFLNLTHRKRINADWRFNGTYQRVSDPRYFEDFSDNVYTASRPYLHSYLQIKGSGEHWLFRAQADDYQLLSSTILPAQKPYQRLPTLNYWWQNHRLSQGLQYGLKAQAVNFYRQDSVTGWRLDWRPYVEKRWQKAWGWLAPRLDYRLTEYDLKQAQGNASPDRSLPIFSLDSGLRLEKNFPDGSFKTLEPRLFYVFAPYRNQNDIPLFDTHELTFGSALLFQTNRFSGADRQMDANQASLAVTHRAFDALGREKWNATVGQIVYFDQQRVQLSDTVQNRSVSPLIAEFNFRPGHLWNGTLSMHWDPETSETERALVRLQRRSGSGQLLNFAYRYRQGKIEQVDSSVVYPISRQNRLLLRWNYSLGANKTIEALAGIEHRSCCWAFRLVARRFIYNEDGDAKNGIYAEIQFNGLGSLGRNPRRLLKQSIPGYSEEY